MFVFDKFDVPVTPSVDDNVVAPEALSVETDVAAAFTAASVDVPVTASVDDNVAAPDADNVVTDVDVSTDAPDTFKALETSTLPTTFAPSIVDLPKRTPADHLSTQDAQVVVSSFQLVNEIPTPAVKSSKIVEPALSVASVEAPVTPSVDDKVVEPVMFAVPLMRPPVAVCS